MEYAATASVSHGFLLNREGTQPSLVLKAQRQAHRPAEPTGRGQPTRGSAGGRAGTPKCTRGLNIQNVLWNLSSITIIYRDPNTSHLCCAVQQLYTQSDLCFLLLSLPSYTMNVTRTVWNRHSEPLFICVIQKMLGYYCSDIENSTLFS